MPGRLIGSFAALALAVLATFGTTTPASAQTCSVSASDINFGLIDVLSGSAVDANGALTVRCTGKGNQVVRVCVSLGYPDGGQPGAAARSAISGPDRLSYQLYSDPAYRQVFGSYAQGGPGGIEFDLVLGPDSAGASATHQQAIYGRVLGGQKTAAPLRYVVAFAGANATYTAQYASGIPCASLLAATKSFAFHMSARVPPRCSVTTGTMDFGAQTTLATAIDTTSSLGVLCSRGLPYSIEVNGGRAGAADPARRRMMLGNEHIEYGLYRDAARAQPWGSTRGINMLGSMGTGVMQAVPVYGRVHPQPTPSAGVYTDTVVVTLTY